MGPAVGQHLLEPVVAAGTDTDDRAFRGHAPGNAGTDPGRRSRDQHLLACEETHYTTTGSQGGRSCSKAAISAS